MVALRNLPSAFPVMHRAGSDAERSRGWTYAIEHFDHDFSRGFQAVTSLVLIRSGELNTKPEAFATGFYNILG